MNWRIYRLPGSREVWHVDNGAGTDIVNVLGYQCGVPSRSVDIGGNNVPRAWIEISGMASLHIIDGVAVFGIPCKCKYEVGVHKGVSECAVSPHA